MFQAVLVDDLSADRNLFNLELLYADGIQVDICTVTGITSSSILPSFEVVCRQVS